jgi:hypothetical protein
MEGWTRVISRRGYIKFGEEAMLVFLSLSLCQVCFLICVMGLFDHSLNWVLIILFVLDVCGATWKFGFFTINLILLIVDGG